MTYETLTEPRPVPAPKKGTKPINMEEIGASFKGVGEDIGQISKLLSEEKLLVTQFFTSLHELMESLTPSIAVSHSVLPRRIGQDTQAYIDSTGHLTLTFQDGHQELIDLSESKNRDLLMAVIEDIMPKLKELISQKPEEEIQEPSVQEPPEEVSPPELLPKINVETPVGLEDSAPTEVLPEDVPEPAAPVLSEEEKAKISAVEAETLGYLEQLGSEVFEHSPVSMYFDDWMVNLRQVILSFESSDIISADEAFAAECNQIFNTIEGELANRLLKEAELEVSAKTLAENRHLLGEIDAGYAAQTKDLVVRGKSAIDFLIKNVQHLEQELAEIEKIKTSYLHPLKKLAKEQRQAEVTEKLSVAKKRLALAVQSSAVETGNLDVVDAECTAQSRDLAGKRESAIEFLAKNVRDLEEELAKLEQTKLSSLHFLKKVANEEKQLEVMQKLNAAKKRLELAQQSSGAEQEKLQDEYEKQKQAMVARMQGLEKDIADKRTDGSLEVRKAACNALANAVKSLIERKTAPTQ